MEVLIVGAGASGLMAAGFAARGGCRVTVVERNSRPARKVMITGKGRCNLTNDCSLDTLMENVPHGGRFLYSAFAALSPQELMALIESLGVPLKTERGSRVFPVSDRAADIADALTAFGTKRARLISGRAVRLLIEDGRAVGVSLEDGRTLRADRVVVCTGGLSYPATGSTGDGYALARQAGHTVVPPTPSLVPLVVRGDECPSMQGLSLRNIGLSVWDNARRACIYRDFGELLFTHFGLSGPVILSASAHLRPMRPDAFTLRIDLKPALSEEQLDRRLLRDLEAGGARDALHLLRGLAPVRLVPILARRAQLPTDCKGGQITREMRRRLIETLKSLAFPVEGFRPIEEAVVTSGGVSTRELDPSTMQSKLCRGLYFAGEVIDVDAYTGGFNLQIAFSTGALAGRSVCRADQK